MANVKIPQLAPLTPATTDLALIWDVSADAARKSTVGEIVDIINGDVEVASNGTATISELPVSKLQDGAARQLLQTAAAAAGTGVEWTSAALNVAGLASLDGGIDVDGAFTVANTSG